MKRIILICTIPGILLMFADIPQDLHAQTFDPGNSEVVFRNLTGVSCEVHFDLAGMVFDEDLIYNDTYASVTWADVNSNEAHGYDCPTDVQVNPSGDVTQKIGVIGTGRYKITIVGPSTLQFFIDLIDANWGLYQSPHRLLIDMQDVGGQTTCRVWVIRPGSNALNYSVTVNQNDVVLKYWMLKRLDPQYSTYTRNRTGVSGTNFTLRAGNIPFTFQGLTDVTLDVNVNVTTNVTGILFVPANNTLRIEADTDNPIPLSTTLRFNSGTQMVVLGSILTNMTTTDGNTFFVPSTYPNSSPGDWERLYIHSNYSQTTVKLNHCYVYYARHGLIIRACNNPETYECVVKYSLNDGVTLNDAAGVHQVLTSTNHGANALRILGTWSFPYIHNSIIGSTDASAAEGNGVVVEQGAHPRIWSSMISNNKNHGIFVLTGSRLRIDSSLIHSNGLASDPPAYDGVHAFENDYWTTIRFSKIYNNDCGVRLNSGNARGYYFPDYIYPPNPMDPSYADSSGMNCIYENRYNVFADEGLFEMARDYYDYPGGVRTVHFQGNYNSIFDASILQGWFKNNTNAFLMRNWWKNNFLFQVQNSFLSTEYDIPSDLTTCEQDSLARGSLFSKRAATTSSQLYALWSVQARQPASFRQTILSTLSTLTPVEASMAFSIVSQITPTTQANSFFNAVLSQTSSDDVKRRAMSNLGLMLMRQERWLEALKQYEAIATLSNRSGSSRYTSAHAIAAYMEHYAGSTADALFRLDTLLSAFPDDQELRMARFLIGGDARNSSPKPQISNLSQYSFRLETAYPNPFNPTTIIAFELQFSAYIRLSVRNILGQEVAVLSEGEYSAGRHSVTFDARNLPGGVYMYTLAVGDRIETKKIMLTK